MINLFFGGTQFKASFGNEFGNIELDATLDETHEWQADVTTNPVEVGAEVADHIIEVPDRLTLRGFVSDSPLNGILGNVVALINGISENRSQAVFDLLHQLIKEKQPMTVATRMRTYTDMVLTNVSVPRSRATGLAIEFVAEFTHIRLVSTQTVDVPDGISEKKDAKATDALGRKAEPTKNGGAKQPEAPARQSQSVLSGILG